MDMDDSVVTGWGGREGVEVGEGIWKINGDGEKIIKNENKLHF